MIRKGSHQMSANKEHRSSVLERIGGVAARGTVLAGVVLAIASCSGGGTMSAPAVSGSGPSVTGRIMGGQQPVAGSQVTVYVAGAAGLGQAGTALAGPVTTDANGTFSFAAGSINCPAAGSSGDLPVYLVAVGGDAGSGSNPSLALSAGLAHCSDLTGTFVNIDEVTTVASVWAMSQFLDASGVQLSTTGSSAGHTGLTNAALTIQNLADVTTGMAATSLVANALGTPPTATLNTLANILARCVNSNGAATAADPCGALFTAATPAGGTAPTTTLAAAYNIARNPSNGVSTLFATTSTTDPFQPALTAAPTDWTLAIQFTGGELTSGDPGSIALDAAGNAWVTSDIGDPTVNGGNGFVLPLSPQGLQASPVADGGVFQPTALAFDPNGQLWIVNAGGPSTVNSGIGSVTGISTVGGVISAVAGSPFIGAADAPFEEPSAIAVAANGDIWVGDVSPGEAGGLGFGRVTTLSAASAYAATNVLLPENSARNGAPAYEALGFDASGNLWVGDAQNPAILELPGASASSPVFFTDPSYLPPGGTLQSLKVGPSGVVWATLLSLQGVTQLTPDAAATGGYDGVNHPLTILSAGAAVTPQVSALAIDGAGKPWIGTSTGSGSVPCVLVLGTDGTNLSSSSGGAIGCLGNSQIGTRVPAQLAIDSSGNLWISNSVGASVYLLVGVAVPVTTPLIGYAQPL